MLQQVVPGHASAAAVSKVDSAATSTPLLANNSARAGVVLYNSDANALLLKYGATASSSSYTYRIASAQTWEMPNPIYTGPIEGIWESDGSGSAFITELTV